MKKYAFSRGPGFTVAAMIGVTLLAKILGLVRQTMIAGIFAASPEGIAFSAASGIPLAVFDMLFSTAVLGSFLPIYKGKLISDCQSAKAFSSSFLSAVLLVTSAAAALGVLLARPILSLAAPELDAETAALAVTLMIVIRPARYRSNTIYQLVIAIFGVFSVLLWMLGWSAVEWPAVAASGVSLLCFSAMLVFSTKRTHHELKKRFHV